jgi:hypothetical protein
VSVFFYNKMAGEVGGLRLAVRPFTAKNSTDEPISSYRAYFADPSDQGESERLAQVGTLFFEM